MKSISFAQREIGRHQLEAQKRILENELLRVEIEISILADDKVYQTREALRLLLLTVEDSLSDHLELPHRSKGLIDRLKIGLYMWAVRGRFD